VVLDHEEGVLPGGLLGRLPVQQDTEIGGEALQDLVDELSLAVAHLVGTLWTALPDDQRVDPVGYVVSGQVTRGPRQIPGLQLILPTAHPRDEQVLADLLGPN